MFTEKELALLERFVEAIEWSFGGTQFALPKCPIEDLATSISELAEAVDELARKK